MCGTCLPKQLLSNLAVKSEILEPGLRHLPEIKSN